jgi:hypothetical protein
MKQYPGPVGLDGVAETVRVVKSSATPVTIISICQASTRAAALDYDPTIVENSRV